MGLAAVAGHLVVLVALVSAGTVLVAAWSDNVTDIVDAQSEAMDRMREHRGEELDLRDHYYESSEDRVMANWTNNGSEEIRFDALTLVVDGQWTDHDTVERFQVRDAAGSEVWAPGEVLEVRVEGQGNVDVGITAPHGTASYRRA